MIASNGTGIDLSFIVAAYNEGAILAENIQRIKRALDMRPGVVWELILVNDGSQDDTKAIMDLAMQEDNRIRVHHHWRNFGQGCALRNGFAMAQGRIILTWDADLSYDPLILWKLYDCLGEEKVEIVLASPYAPGGRTRNVPGYRYFLSRWGNTYLAFMNAYHVHTLTCVVRAYRREVIDEMFCSSNGMELQLEILMKASILNFRVSEIPAELAWSNSKRSEGGAIRVSKMRIAKTIWTYLLYGWLFRPSYWFVVLGWLFLVPGIYMGGWFVYRIYSITGTLLHQGSSLSSAISEGISLSYAHYPQTLIVGSTLSLVGLLVWLFSLVVTQSQYYYTELYRQNMKLSKDIQQFKAAILEKTLK